MQTTMQTTTATEPTATTETDDALSHAVEGSELKRHACPRLDERLHHAQRDDVTLGHIPVIEDERRVHLTRAHESEH